MDTPAFHHWLAQLKQLSTQQRTTLNQALAVSGAPLKIYSIDCNYRIFIP
ncbi:MULTISPECIES: hypothetical protein [Pseudomonas]|nr:MULTISPECIES: hypothetical protein [Pseudomonas]